MNVALKDGASLMPTLVANAAKQVVSKWPLTVDQKAAMAKIGEWLLTAKGGDIFRLYGLAGTGKTTCSVDLRNMGVRILYIAFTNRAVSVLESKGCSPARTCHSVLYNTGEYSEEEQSHHRAMKRAYMEAVEAGVPVDQRPPLPHSQRRVGFSIRTPEELADIMKDYDVVACDECSFIGDRVGRDLLLLNKPIIAIGDPGQLQPVGDRPFFSRRDPEVLLTKVLRTDGDILVLADHVRNGGSFTNAPEGEDFEVRRKAAPEWFYDVDQIICGIHDKRRALNAHVRKLNNYEGAAPGIGEKLLTVANKKDEGMLNGTLWVVTACEVRGDYAVLDLVEFAPRRDPEDLEFRLDINVHLDCFRADIKDATEMGIDYRNDSVLMTWGYAITCHKSQGSEWDRVMVFDDGPVFRDQVNEWRYAAATRAATKLYVVSRH